MSLCENGFSEQGGKKGLLPALFVLSEMNKKLACIFQNPYMPLYCGPCGLVLLGFCFDCLFHVCVQVGGAMFHPFGCAARTP